MSKKDGGPAFPVMWDYAANETGMSLRDYFAGQALIGIVANPAICPDPARSAYQYADAMIAERERTTNATD